MKDPRYKAIKSLIETGSIKTLAEVFTIIPLSLVRNDLKINYNTLRKKVDRTELITIKDIMSLASLFEVEPMEVYKLCVFDGIKAKKANKR